MMQRPQVVLTPLQQLPLQQLQQPTNTTTTRNLAVKQLIIGILSSALGIATFPLLHQTFSLRAGFWAGGWITLTGLTGVCSARKNNSLNCVYLVFSVLSTCGCVIAGFFISVAIIHYALLDSCDDDDNDNFGSSWCSDKPVGLGLNVPLLVLMVTEFIVSIVAACRNGCYSATTPPQHQPVVIQQQQQPLLQGGQNTVVIPTGYYPPMYPSQQPQQQQQQQQQQMPPRTGGYPPQQQGQVYNLAPQPEPQYGAHVVPQYGAHVVPQYGAHVVQQPPPYTTVSPSAPGFGPQHGEEGRPPAYSEKPPAY